MAGDLLDHDLGIREMVLRLLVWLSCAVICGYAQSVDSVRKLAGLTNDQWKAVEAGKVVAKVLETSYKREVAVAGVARVQVSTACFLDQFRDIENFKKSPAVRQIGKFNTPISSGDLSALTLDSQDVDALRQCKIGSCAMKIPSTVIQRLARPAQAPEQSFVTRANAVLRDELLNYIHSYLSLGDQDLITYHDRGKPVLLCEQFHSMLTGWSSLHELAPEFCDVLTRGPQQPLPFLEEILYWSKESFGLKPVISVTHVTIFRLPGQTWIASKQIYASHYFDASLAITLVANDPADPSGNSIYLAYVNRSRIDLLGGAFAGFVRHMVRGRLEDGMRKNLQQTVTRLESACGPALNLSERR